MVNLLELAGINETYAQQLRQAGVSSASDLLEIGATPQGRRRLAAQTQIELKLITSWVHQLDLQRIDGIGAGYASLLESAGVESPRALGRRNPENLHQALERTNQREQLVRRMPSASQVEGWVAQAGSLGGNIGTDNIP